MSVTIESGTCSPEDMRKAIAEVEAVLGVFIELRPTGSVYTNGMGNDCDVLVLGSLRDRYTLVSAGYEVCGATAYGDASSSDWVALRRGNVNVLLCYSAELYSRWAAAAEVCKWLGGCTKQQRVLVHELVKNHCSLEEAYARAAAY